MSALQKRFDDKYKVSEYAVTYTCGCKENGSVTIDPTSTTSTCGVVGVCDFSNVKFIKSTINCLCGKIINIPK